MTNKAALHRGSLLDGIRRRGELRISVAFSRPPEEGGLPEFYIDPETGRAAGVVCELGRIMAQDLGVKTRWVDIPWPEHMRALLTGRVDLLLSYTNTPQRALEVEFAGPLLPSQVVALLHKTSPVQKKEDLNAPGQRLGIWHGSSIAAVSKRLFPLAITEEYSDPASQLKKGKVDACVVDAVTNVFMVRHPNLRLLRDQKGALVVLAEEYGHPAIRPGDQRFLNWIDNWLDYHRAQGTIDYWCGTWWESWMAR